MFLFESFDIGWGRKAEQKKTNVTVPKSRTTITKFDVTCICSICSNYKVLKFTGDVKRLLFFSNQEKTFQHGKRSPSPSQVQPSLHRLDFATAPVLFTVGLLFNLAARRDRLQCTWPEAISKRAYGIYAGNGLGEY